MSATAVALDLSLFSAKLWCFIVSGGDSPVRWKGRRWGGVARVGWPGEGAAV